MKGKPLRSAFHLPKRLGSLMVLVAGSALTFQMVRGVTSRPGAVAPRPVAPAVLTFPGLVLQPRIPDLRPQAVANRPFFVVEHPLDEAILKNAPEAIDDSMIIDPLVFRKR
jgi:hypothetical protein